MLLGSRFRDRAFGIVRSGFILFWIEIAEIKALNLAYLQKPTQAFSAMNDHARRSQRLIEIMDELRSMTEWKKT
jgi:hypothetical protein